MLTTEFFQKEPGGDWYWHTKAANNKIVAVGGEGYNRLSGAVHGYCVANDISMDDATLASKMSQLTKVDDRLYVIEQPEGETNDAN